MTRYNNIAIFGCKSTSLFLLRMLTTKVCKVIHVITIAAELGSANEVADYYDLKKEVEQMGISVYQAKHSALKNADDIGHINGLKIDIAFVIGWQ